MKIIFDELLTKKEFAFSPFREIAPNVFERVDPLGIADYHAQSESKLNVYKYLVKYLSR